MKHYQDYLKYKYDTLELASPDEMLECYSPQYIDLTLIKNYKRKPIRQNGQNKRVGVKQDSDLEYVSLSEALDVEKEKKKIVLIEGGPGMGKTTLAINICKCWAKGELLQSYDAVILLTLRDPEIQEAKTINDLLLIRDDELRDNVYKEIVKRHGNRICFIFEGFDELPNHLHKSAVFSKVIDDLPKCMLIYTSRPNSCMYWLTNISVIKINGFTEESVNEYISEAFENEQDTVSLRMQIDSNPEIKNILHIPINVAIVCLIFFHFSKLPDKLTELYTLLCLRLIFRHIVKRTPNETNVEKLSSLNDLPKEISKEFSCLCYIAFKGICNDKIIFSSEDLHDMDVVENKISGLGLLLVAPSTSVYGIKKSYNFLHKTLQEFCAAWYITKLTTEEQITYFNPYLNCDHNAEVNSDMVWRFYSGITKLNGMEDVNSVWPYKSVVSPILMDKLSVLMKLIYEADNTSLCQVLGEYFNGAIDIHDNDFFDEYYNIQALSYFLTHYKGTLTSYSLSFMFDINEKASQVIAKSLEKRLSLDIFPSITGIREDLFSKFALSLAANQYCVVELHICKSYREAHMKPLSQILCNSKTLKVLWIESDEFGFMGALCLADCRNLVLKDLRLPSCKMGSLGACAIGQMLSCNNSIKSVDLSVNEIDDVGIEHLVDHLKKNDTLQSLNLKANRITAFGAIYLREIINTLCCITLSNNPLGHIGIYLILEAVTVPMKCIELWNRDTSYSYRSVASILDKVRSISFRVPDDYEGCKVICEGLTSITMLEKLEISIDIGESDLSHHKLLLNTVEQTNIKTLLVHYRCFTDEIATDLAKFIKNTKSITSLSIECGELSPQGFLLIADSLTENTSIIALEISNVYSFYCDTIDKNFVLEFLYQLKQVNTLKWLTLHIWLETNIFVAWDYEAKFYQDLDISVQQINYTRSMKDVDPLELVIGGCFL